MVDPAPTSLDRTALTQLKGVGPGLESRLRNLGIHDVQDLLFHLPMRYQDRTRITPIGRARLGMEVLVEGEIASCQIAFGRKRSLVCSVVDSSGVISLRFYHFSAAQKNALQVGLRIRCYGEPRRGRNGLEIYHPEYQFITAVEADVIKEHLTPVYPATEGLQQARLRAIIDQALTRMRRRDSVRELLPAEVRTSLGSMKLADAIEFLHHPPSDVSLEQLLNGRHPAQQRLAVEELLSHRLCMRKIREASDIHLAPAMKAGRDLVRQFITSLPFQLTGAQKAACKQIGADLAIDRPMLRLLQGDVGSGKTVVAAIASLQAIAAEYQVAVMAPTEILAEQHLITFSQWFHPLGIEVGWLSGKLKGKKRDSQLAEIENGTCRIVVGTHALFQKEVAFMKLGLIVIDEQHRFGVHQRMALRDKSGVETRKPHQLVMTATPIPRTLAMTAYADLDCTIINELPPGRTPVKTAVIPEERRGEIIEAIKNACADGSQAYWVCPLIEESEALQCQAAEVTAQTLTGQLPGIRVGLIHGRMKPAQKTDVMMRFKQGEIQLLVATTVIEVGVDVPNASVMVIENAERLGLAQLHQLRGRVGRGAVASHCMLVYKGPLSQTGKKRLAVMRNSNDGFYIAEQDLEIRGPGQVLGTQQTGLMTFRVADIARDADLLEDVRKHSELIRRDHPELVEPLIDRWLGDREHYANV
ncbi:MAG: ATP-dependent DNA helicase RecG [Pseudohongiellaceae bacterium]